MNGPMISENGDVVSSALSTGGYSNGGAEINNNLSIQKGQIIKVYAIDDPKSAVIGKPVFIVYDVSLYLPDGSSEIVKRCIAAQPLFGGGFNNFLEVTPNDPGPAAIDPSRGILLKRGTMVLVGFMGGKKSGGVIIGALPHPSPVAIARRPTVSEGSHLEGEFQGLNWMINNDGSLKVIFNGPRDDSGKIIGTDGPTVLEIDAKGNIDITTNNQQEIKVDRVNGVCSILNGTTLWKSEQNGSRIYAESDYFEVKARKDVTVNAGGDAKVTATNIKGTASADVSIQAGGNAVVDAKMANVNAPIVNVNASSGMNINSPTTTISGLLNVGGLVSCAGLGAGAPPVAGQANIAGDLNTNGSVNAGNQIKDSKGTLDALRTAYDSHTHSDPQGGSTGPATPQV